MKKITESFDKLEKLYSSLPGMPCISCGLCCVSPHMTLVEFAYMLSGMLKSWDKQQLIDFIKKKPEAETRYEGNFVCKFQGGKGDCSLHKYRSMICRLEGFPVLNKMGIRDYIICPYITDENMESTVNSEDIDRWVEETFNLSNEFCPVYEEPYWLSGLNVDCWFAIALDKKITQPFILNVKAMIRESFDIDFLEESYVDYTSLSEKLNLVDNFFVEAGENKNPKKAITILKDIMDKYPFTGSYYLDEAEKYMKLMKKIVREQRKVN